MVVCTCKQQPVQTETRKVNTMQEILVMKTLVVYVHLLSACVAVGSLLLQDIGLCRARARKLLEREIEDLKKTIKVISVALILLWVSGIALVTLGYMASPEKYLANEKLWAKITVVVILTVNGFVLHSKTFPKFQVGTVFVHLPTATSMLVVLTGSISTVTWLFACYLGIARPWNYTLDYKSIMALYLGILIFVFICGQFVVRLSGKHAQSAVTQASI